MLPKDVHFHFVAVCVLGKGVKGLTMRYLFGYVIVMQCRMVECITEGEKQG